MADDGNRDAQAQAATGHEHFRAQAPIRGRKLWSCATLFACVVPAPLVFDRLLEKYYGGERDQMTLELLGLEK